MQIHIIKVVNVTGIVQIHIIKEACAWNQIHAHWQNGWQGCRTAYDVSLSDSTRHRCS